MNKYLTEFTGTMILVLIIALSANPLAIGIGLAALVYMGAHISGSHYNPAVTLALFALKKIKSDEAIKYMISQVSGAFLAALLVNLSTTKPFVVAPDSTVATFVPYLLEIIFTFALVSTVLNTAVSEKSKGNSYFGFAIGGIVMAGAFSVGSISGGAFNPAVGLAPILVSAAQTPESGAKLLLYLLGPSLGALLAAYYYKFTQS